MIEQVNVGSEQIFRVGFRQRVRDLSGNVIAVVETVIGEDGNKITIYAQSNVKVEVIYG